MITETKGPDHFAKIIDKITEKSKEIIDKIETGSASENLRQIAAWINQVKPESSVTDVYLAIIINTIHFYFKNEFSSEQKILIEASLCIIIDDYNLQPTEEISRSISLLSKYISTSDDEDKSELEEFIGKLTTPTDRFGLRKISNQIVLSYEKYKSDFNNTFNSKLKEIAIAKLSSELQPDSEHKSFSEIDSFKRNKIKPSLIYFDKKGKGHRVKPSSKKRKKSLDFFDKYENLNEFIDKRKKYEDNLEKIEKSVERKFNRLAKLSLEDKDTELFRRLDSIEKTRIRKTNARILQAEKATRIKTFKLWKPILASIEEKINKFKEQYAKLENQDILDNIYVDLLSLEGNKNKRLIGAFLKYINYDKFRLLVKIAKETYSAIENTRLILNRIDKIRENFGFHKKYINCFQQELDDFTRIFSNESILNFFENSFRLYKLIKLNPNQFINFSNFEFGDISKNISLKAPACLEVIQSLDEIISNQQLAIEIFLKKFNKHHNLYQRRIPASFLYNNKNNIFKKFFAKFKHFLMNFFTVRFYFIDERYFLNFLQKMDMFIENQNQSNLTIDSVSNFLNRLTWKTLISYGINPMHLYQRDVKKRLVQFLFLSLINQKFEKAISDLVVTPNTIHRRENTDTHSKRLNISDKLFALIKELSFLGREDILYDVNNKQNNIFKGVKSREDVFCELENNDEVKDLLSKIPIFKSRMYVFIDGFFKVFNATEENIKNLEKNQEKDDILTQPSSNSLFKLSKTDSVQAISPQIQLLSKLKV
jgi:hypothetical protein